MGSLRWNGEQVSAQIRGELRKRINYCCMLVMQRAKTLINVEGAMHHKDVLERAGKDAKFAKQFNRNRAFANTKKAIHNVRYRQGKLIYTKRKGED